MNCIHCLYDCKSTGEDITIETFEKCLKVVEKFKCDDFTLGGGEPTLHPEFNMLFDMAMSVRRHLRSNIRVITNGTCDENTWKALKYWYEDGRGLMDLIVSNDLWHDASKVSPWVKKDKLYTKSIQWVDEENPFTLIHHGRAVHNKEQIVKDIKEKTKRTGVFFLLNNAGTTPRVDP
jgi:organic radical activating enzyme